MTMRNFVEKMMAFGFTYEAAHDEINYGKYDQYDHESGLHVLVFDDGGMVLTNPSMDTICEHEPGEELTMLTEIKDIIDGMQG